MLEEFQVIWDGHLGQLNTATHRVEEYSPEAKSMHAVPYRADLKTRETERVEHDEMQAMKVVEPEQKELASPIVSV